MLRPPVAADPALPEVIGGGHDDPVVGCMACRFDRQVYGIKIELV
jgi:hypothetical protein